MGQSNFLPNRSVPNSRWKQLYAAAVLELDDTKLLTRIAEARAAICARAGDALVVLSEEERGAISDGLRILRVLEEMFTNRNPAA